MRLAEEYELTIGGRMHVWEQSKNASIASLLKECQAGHQPHHRGFRVGIHETNEQHQCTHHYSKRMHQDLPSPQRFRSSIHCGQDKDQLCLKRLDLVEIRGAVWEDLPTSLIIPPAGLKTALRRPNIAA